MKSKKIVTILLSLAIMFTFMPAMAFAVEGVTSTAGHVWASDGVDADGTPYVLAKNVEAKKVKVLVEPTCDFDGVGEVACGIELNGEACGEALTVLIKSSGHTLGDRVRVTAEEMMDHFGYTATEKKAFYKSSPYKCFAYVYKCKDCGAYITKEKTLITKANWMADENVEKASGTETGWTGHTAPSDTLDCAASFTCEQCKVAGMTDSTKHNLAASRTFHTTESFKMNADGNYVTDELGNKIPVVEKSTVYVHKTNGDADGSKAVQVDQFTCKLCGTVTAANPKSVTRTEGKWVVDTTQDVGAVCPHDKYTEVVKVQPTCMAVGKSVKVCDICGYEFGESEIAKIAHNYVTTTLYGTALTAYPSLDPRYVYTADICTNEGCTSIVNVQKVGFATIPEAKAEYTLAANANCEQGSWVVENYTALGATKAVRTIISDKKLAALVANDDSNYKKIGDAYYNVIGTNNQVSIPFTKATGHKFGAVTAVKEADCLNPGIDAKVCENCGKIDHATKSSVGKALGHEVQEITVSAKCGDGGYTYKVCTRCNEYLDKNGKTAYENASAEDKPTTKPYAIPQKYNETKPVVSKDTACQYEWKVLEEATPFVMGTRAKVCSVCGDELAATKESIAKTTIAAPAVKSLKKKAKVTVKAVAGADKYQILVNGKVSKTVTKAGKFTVKKYVKAGKKNKFQIRAINADGVKATSKAKTVKIKKK